MFKGFGEKLLSLGCLWAVLMFVSFILGLAYQGLMGQKEDLGFLYTLAIPLAVVLGVTLAILSPRAERREKERKAEEERNRAEERREEIEYESSIWKRSEEEAMRRQREKEEERHNTTCTECGMRIPMYSRICPYCRTRRS